MKLHPRLRKRRMNAGDISFFGSSCVDLVMGRGQEDPHKASTAKGAAIPRVQFHFGCMSLGDEGTGVTLTMLTGIELRTDDNYWRNR